jgi:serine/threonine protein kinase
MDRAAASMDKWDEDEMILDSLIQEAVRNHGRVDLMHRKKDRAKFAVKRMPNRWVREGPADFNEQYPTASERPWVDIGLVRHLNSIKYPYACELHGVFRDSENTYVCSSLATKGDLFAWCDKDPKPGSAREEVMIPLAVQIFSAVRLLHELGIAHRDLSLENILLTEVEGDTRVQLIDFGMSTTTRFCRKEVRGKQSYQAPEMHTAPQYDAFLADAFSLGVVLFAMAVQDYPWTSTKKNTCQLFEYITTFGFQKLGWQ